MITLIYFIHNEQHKGMSPHTVQSMVIVATVWWLIFVGILYYYVKVL